MEALIQLSEVQRAFIQFCSILQELILNHKVAHSVVQSLHNDLPVLQPERKGSTRNAMSSGFGAGSGGPRTTTSGDVTGKKPSSALDHLKFLAPRLTPTMDTAAGAAAAVDGNPSYRVAAECQDNYIVLQNATYRSRDLLGRLRQLQLSAFAALEQQNPDLGAGEAISDPEVPEPGTTQSAADGTVTALGSDVNADIKVGMDIDIDVLLDLPRGTVTDGVATAPAVLDDAIPTPGAGTMKLTTSPPYHSSVAPPTAGPPVLPRPGTDLAILMGEVCREMSLELELLGRVARAIELQTSAEDLYVYDTILKLQPYTDERVIAAALAQRDLLAPTESILLQGGLGRR